ncbi:MAG: hypothetical protein CLLPBCKN_000092 [Chroococcidiopsis cubana SAG 39.79]|uniref:Uncharacterized protein n=1 Tax=Chroococcidiopsis cubana SAG 39.79 TaxID=388085 RepID=A0AB37U8S1_9CYAN|nr:hypothetical protein [Chroococcidiopsis cubana]MDZ4870704.1 hypothetical protein [Chroococcidiopsis cubana SAG 39.79]PSB57970.1 hypothetical protein C7B79_30415 [Chroococcidiopsis cubana CCALA 043]RUS99143.1 hypothetical protein DSM107010_69010 [Chroococcidiopsis cubana SAG 39.79]
MTKPELAKQGEGSTEQVNFSFRCQPKRDSKYGVLLSYINEDSAELTRRERVLNALAAFWLPFAYHHQGEISVEELQRLARSSIYQLQLHVQYLRDTFELSNTEPPVYAFAKSVRNSSRPAVENYVEEDDDCETETDIVSSWH